MGWTKVAFIAALIQSFSPTLRADCTQTIDINKSLLIRDLSVVEGQIANPGGALHFGEIVKKLAPPFVSTTTWIDAWFSEWSRSQIQNRSVIPRIGTRLTSFWDRSANGEYRLDLAPMRLLAVTFRGDVKTPHAPEGEARLVYGAFTRGALEPFEFLVIFEYALPGRREEWAKAFRELSCLPFGAEFNQRLEQLYRNFSGNLAQVRTNDFFLLPKWELREFRPDSAGFLKASLVSQTPLIEYSDLAESPLVQWVRSNQAQVLSGDFQIPETLWDATAPVFHERFGWLKRAGLDEKLRRQISMVTCSGCHASETRTIFTHIFPRGAQQVSRISRFLEEDLKLRALFMESLTNPIEDSEVVSAPSPLESWEQNQVQPRGNRAYQRWFRDRLSRVH